MKKAALISFLLFTCIAITAQENNKHEIGINLFSYNSAYTATSVEYENYFRYAIQTSYINGLTYKYHLKSAAIRFTAMYQYEKLPTSNQETDITPGQLYNGEFYTIASKLGFEKRFGTKKFKPYLFADLSFSYGYTNGLDGGSMGPTVCPITYEIKNFSYGVSPGIGVIYQVFPMLSVRLETNINTGYFLQKGKPFYGYKASFGKFYEGAFFSFNPIGIASINIHF